jgi:Rieske Fe-S protein
VNVGTLDTIGRAVRSETPSGRPIIIIRTGDTAYTTLLLVCTHEGCKGSQISYASTILTCTCHGSKFTALGAVVNGPATKPLSTFSTTYNDSDKTVTIVL